MNLIFATHNDHKVMEVAQMLPSNITITSLKELGFNDEIPETGTTLQENAIIKARYAYEKTNAPYCFADDTGLEVLHLNGAPGVYSARYAGEACSAKDNVAKLLREMSDLTSNKRDACFITVIALLIKGQLHLFQGRVDGKILEKPTGIEGFGYDPIFLPNGYESSFAEMSLSMKNKISHRALAFKEMNNFLNEMFF